MKYVGSKNRHAKYMLPIILNGRTTGQVYVEPFVGGANLIDKVTGPRLGADTHIYLIALLKAVASGWVPPGSITEAQYNEIRLAPELYAGHLVGFVGFCCSYSGKWWGGYARSKTASGTSRNHANEARKNLLKQAPKLKGIDFRVSDYLNLDIPKGSIVYCDPPYNNTTQYSGTDNFNSAEFWDWAREISKGNKVFVSEYQAPSDFICLWDKNVVSGLAHDTGAKRGTEKLWKLKESCVMSKGNIVEGVVNYSKDPRGYGHSLGIKGVEGFFNQSKKGAGAKLDLSQFNVGDTVKIKYDKSGKYNWVSNIKKLASGNSSAGTGTDSNGRWQGDWNASLARAIELVALEASVGAFKLPAKGTPDAKQKLLKERVDALHATLYTEIETQPCLAALEDIENDLEDEQDESEAEEDDDFDDEEDDDDDF